MRVYARDQACGFRFTKAAWGAFNNFQPLAVPIVAGPWSFGTSEAVYQAAKFRRTTRRAAAHRGSTDGEGSRGHRPHAGFRDTCPGIELTLRTASFAAGLRRLARGESDLHCGAVDAGAPLPAFLRRERVLDTTAGIVAHAEHPLLAGRPAVCDP